MSEPDAKATSRKQRSRGISTDMSPAALERRLELMSQLYEVWQLLRTAKRIGPRAGNLAEPSPEEWRRGEEPR